MKKTPPTSTPAVAVAVRLGSGEAQSNAMPNVSVAKPQSKPPASLPDGGAKANAGPPEQPTETGGIRNEGRHSVILNNRRLSEIVLDSGLQSRAKVNMATVGEYTERMKAGDKFPPIDVFDVNGVYLLAGGVHRLLAAQKAGLDSFQVQVHHGSRADAVKFAIEDNCAHGLPRTNKDKRRAVQLAITDLSGLSDHVIAEICKVSQPFVSALRRELKTDFSCAKRTGRDGKQRKMPKAQASGEPNEPATAEEPAEPDQGSAESAGEKDKPRTGRKSNAAAVETFQPAISPEKTEDNFNPKSRWQRFRDVLEKEYATWPPTCRSIFVNNLVTTIEFWEASGSQPVQGNEVPPLSSQTQGLQEEANASS